jgi:hypothetical protein
LIGDSPPLCKFGGWYFGSWSLRIIEKDAVPFVPSLMLSSSPSNLNGSGDGVDGFIITVRVDPIKAVILRRSRTDIPEECLEPGDAIRPLRTHFDPPSTVLFITDVSWNRTPSKHTIPNMVFLLVRRR